MTTSLPLTGAGPSGGAASFLPSDLSNDVVQWWVDLTDPTKLGTSGARTMTAGDKVVFNADSLWVASGPFTFAIWINITALPAADTEIVSQLDGSTERWSIRIKTTGAVDFTANGTTRITGAALTTGAWNYIVGTYDGTTVRLYVNNALPISSASTQDTTFATPKSRIGSNGASRFATFKLSKAGIWSRAITAAEVTSFYNERQGEVYGSLTTAEKVGVASYYNGNEPDTGETANNLIDATGNKDLTFTALTNVVNGTFDDDTNWTKDPEWTIASGVATKAPGGVAVLSQDVSHLTVGNFYELTFTVLNRTAGDITASIGSTALTLRDADGTYVESGVCGTPATIVSFSASPGASIDIDNVICTAKGCKSAAGPTTETVRELINGRDGVTFNTGPQFWSGSNPHGTPTPYGARLFANASSERFVSTQTGMDIADPDVESFTIEFMFNSITRPSGGDTFAGAGGASVHRTDAKGDWMCGVRSGGGLGFAIWTAAGNPTSNYQTSTAPLANGIWYHIMYVWTAGVGPEIFVDGVSQALKVPTGVATGWGATRIVGATFTSSSYHMNGRKARFRFWKTVKDAAYGVSAYNNGNGLFHSELADTVNLATSLDMDEVSLGNAIDQVGAMTWADTNTVLAGQGPNLPTRNLPSIDGDGSMRFDGTDDYVRIPADAAWNFGTTSAFTFSLWARWSSLSGSPMLLSTDDGVDGWQFFLVNSTTMAISGGTQRNITVPTALVTDQWYHIAVTRPASATAPKLYIDGALIGQFAANEDFNNDSNNLAIGADADGTNVISGFLDEVKIWNSELTAANILFLATEDATIGTDPGNPTVAHWPGGDGPISGAGISPGATVTAIQEVITEEIFTPEGNLAARRPTFISEADGVLFANSHGMVFAQALSRLTSLTDGRIYISFKSATDAPDLLDVLFGMFSTSDDDHYISVGQGDGTEGYNLSVRAGVPVADSLQYDAGADLVKHLLEFHMGATLTNIFLDGVDVTPIAVKGGSNAGKWFDSPTLTNFVLGCVKNASGASNFCNANLRHVCIANAAGTAENYSDLRAYFTDN